MLKMFSSIYNQSKLNQWINIVGVSFLLITIIRMVEWVLILTKHSVSDSLHLWEFSGVFHDYFVATLLLSILGVFFYISSLVNTRFARFLSLSILLTFLLFNLLLVLYFIEDLAPLSVSDIFGMSQSQVEFISEIYGFKMIYLLGIIPTVLILIFVFNLLTIRVNSKIIKGIVIALICISFGKQVIQPVNEKTFESELNYHIVCNKLYYFIDSWFTYKSDKLGNSDQFNPNSEYPFYNSSEVKDVLSPFFENSTIPPNIVFIISESLGKQYSGKDARLGSFTPFLDSLAEHSLYWQNVVANAERTFGAIPNLMAGLPEGERGFMNLRWNMFDHLSLPLLLKENNNYQTAFYCGAWKHYDNMDEYLMFQKFDYILGKNDFKANLIDHQYTSGEKQFDMQNWGAEDYEVFKQSFEFMTENYDSIQPFFNLYLSTSFHQPYAYTNQSLFHKKAENIIRSIVNKSEQEKYLNRKADFGAILYADYSMQQVFEMYKKAGLFENTIFVICGDHSLKFMNDNPRLDKFHVPLLIYSPLLKKSKNIESIVCQKDVPSAIQGLLKNRFNLNLPDFSISQSNNLDTLTEFSYNDNQFSMMYSNKRLTNFIKNDMLLSDKKLFKIRENLTIEMINDDIKLTELQSIFNQYKSSNNYVSLNNKYLPQNLLTQYSTIGYQVKSFNDFSIRKSSLYEDYPFSDETFFSEPQSIDVKNKKFISIVSNEVVDLTTRVRLVIKYKFHAPTGYMPNLVLTFKDKVFKDKVFYVDKNRDYLKQTTVDGWQSVEVGYWLDKGDNVVISAYIFNAKQEHLFLDDIYIEIRNF